MKFSIKGLFSKCYQVHSFLHEILIVIYLVTMFTVHPCYEEVFNPIYSSKECYSDAENLNDLP